MHVGVDAIVVEDSPLADMLTLVMSLFDLQDVCIAIGSITTLDLPMVVDLIGIYGLKGPYSLTLRHGRPSPSPPTPPPLPSLPAVGRRPSLIDRTCSDQFFEENPSVLISSGLLVQADEGVSLLIVDLIDESTAAYREEPVFFGSGSGSGGGFCGQCGGKPETSQCRGVCLLLLV
ncbi:hypothetical protein F511_27711 [Dorcoceras hygrometricum]|uniref:Uncharacterized protein n=1 Tax=Dorcoceras hygrometricum TaxID=472368 RepID=A0A2Z7AXG1_9LAMI|nr:hypothetical protein F511_27711 [Dorcoceras hygrometricum]